MRTLINILFGAIGGLALGILGPIAMYTFMAWTDPAMKQGGGTPFASTMIITVPLGAVFGAVWGYRLCLEHSRIA